jgi:hypothetical protein
MRDKAQDAPSGDEPERAEQTSEEHRKAKAREIAGDAERGLVPPAKKETDSDSTGAVNGDPA